MTDWGKYGRALAQAATCNRDHCTPEERAVINTGLAFRQAENAHWVESEVGSDPARTYRERSRAYIEFTNACHALLAARAGKEER